MSDDDDVTHQLDREELDKLRADMDEGLRFLHTMTMQTKAVVRDTALKVAALIQELTEGHVDREKLTERMRALMPAVEEKDEQLYHIRVGNNVDKYAITELPDIDCASLIPLCKARCCKLTVFLSFRDLDEGKLKWDYGAPYILRRGPDGYCVHNDKTAGTYGCTVYNERPVVCRTYDCRNDTRIWVDFEKRIVAPEEGGTKGG